MTSTAIVLFVAGAARAEPRGKGFALDRFEPSDRGSRWFYADSLDQRYAAGVVFDYGRRPLVLYSPAGKKVAIVEDQLFSHVGATVVLGKRLRLALSVPVALFQDGEAVHVSTMVFESDQATTLGDVRIGGDVLLAGQYGGSFALSAGLRVFAPTGSPESYTSNGSPRLVPKVNVAVQESSFAFAAQLGLKLRAWSDELGFHVGPKDDDFAGSSMGGDAEFAAAAGVKLAEGRITLGPEFSFATVAGDPKSFLATRTTSSEVLLGAHFALGGFRFGSGVGPGITRGFGTPAIRAVLSLEWVEPAVPARPRAAVVRDRDHDGIADSRDACPDEPGIRTDDVKTNGCRRPADRDADGVSDALDACPDKAGPQTGDPKTNGCPKPEDRDADGVADALDACPDKAGIQTDDPKTNGCPKDRDGDGIADAEDACPDVAGVRSVDPAMNGCTAQRVARSLGDRDEDGIPDAKDACPDAEGPKLKDPTKTGCPLARIEDGQIRLRERVEFATGSAALLVYSQAVLKAVLKILQQDLSIRHVVVQAHTDSRGHPAYNKRLSQRRADSVVKWLVDWGIARERLTAEGFGEERPIDSNDTAAGRLNNRRVEFIIVERNGSSQ